MHYPAMANAASVDEVHAMALTTESVFARDAFDP
jgi:hypothetical protein